MYPSDYHGDGESSSCSECGCDMEVIGPPGPVHRSGCSQASKPAPPGRSLSDDEADYLFGFDPLPETREEIELLLAARGTGRPVAHIGGRWRYGIAVAL